MKARLISLLLCFALLVSFLPVCVSAEEDSRSFTDSFQDGRYTVTVGYYYGYGGLRSSASTYLPYFYSDGYFSGSSAEDNAHLATMSLNLAVASTHNDKDTVPYSHAVTRRMLAEIGCEEQSIYFNAASVTDPTAESIAFALAYKPLKLHSGEFYLLPIAVRGGGYGDEWISNLTVGAEGEAKGFRDAANIVLRELDAYLEQWGLAEAAENGKVKFWPVGYSRGGAVADLAAKDLIDRYGADSVYCYTFEAPMGGLQSLDSDKYDCIHNYVNYADIVPLFMPGGSGFGFTRYGTDHVFPAIQGYDEAFSAMEIQLAAVYPKSEYIKVNNAFRLHYLNTDIKDYLKNISSIGTDLLLKEISYDYQTNDGNSIYFIGHFLRAFMTQFQNRKQTWGMYERAQYASNRFKLDGTQYPYTIEEAFKGLIPLLIHMDSKLLDQISDQSTKYINSFSTLDYLALVGVYNDLMNGLRYWNDGTVNIGTIFPNYYQDSDRMDFFKELWKHAEKIGIPEILADHGFDVGFIEDIAAPLFFFMFSVASLDYNTKAKDYPDGLGFKNVNQSFVLLGTLFSNMDIIETNHNYWPNLAWVRSFDSYYLQKNVSPSTRSDSSLAAPAAYVESLAASADSGTFTSVCCGEQVYLDTLSCTGETIFYDLYDITNDAPVASNQLYYASVPMPACSGTETSYRITARAYSNGILSGAASYYVKTVPSCRFTSVELTENGVSYTFTGNYNSDEENLLVLAAAYEQGKQVQVVCSAPVALSEETKSGTLELERNEAYAYKLYIVDSETSVPLALVWSSEAG